MSEARCGKELQFKKLGSDVTQKCPLCGMPQEIWANYWKVNDRGGITLYTNKGYSYCNCNNIFYTDWSNIDTSCYGENYIEAFKYPVYKQYADEATKRYVPRIMSLNPNAKSFLEIGSPVDYVADGFKDFDCTLVDIGNRDSKYKYINGNIEDSETRKKLGKYDVIWAGHVIEHLKDPIETLKFLTTLLNDNGIFWIAMPDPYYINIPNKHYYNHFLITQHHILFEMVSFIKIMEGLGYSCEFWDKLSGIDYIKLHEQMLEYHLIFQKVK